MLVFFWVGCPSFNWIWLYLILAWKMCEEILVIHLPWVRPMVHFLQFFSCKRPDDYFSWSQECPIDDIDILNYPFDHISIGNDLGSSSDLVKKRASGFIVGSFKRWSSICYCNSLNYLRSFTFKKLVNRFPQGCSIIYRICSFWENQGPFYYIGTKRYGFEKFPCISFPSFLWSSCYTASSRV